MDIMPTEGVPAMARKPCRRLAPVTMHHAAIIAFLLRTTDEETGRNVRFFYAMARCNRRKILSVRAKKPARERVPDPRKMKAPRAERTASFDHGRNGYCKAVHPSLRSDPSEPMQRPLG